MTNKFAFADILLGLLKSNPDVDVNRVLDLVESELMSITIRVIKNKFSNFGSTKQDLFKKKMQELREKRMSDHAKAKFDSSNKTKNLIIDVLQETRPLEVEEKSKILIDRKNEPLSSSNKLFSNEIFKNNSDVISKVYKDINGYSGSDLNFIFNRTPDRLEDFRYHKYTIRSKNNSSLYSLLIKKPNRSITVGKSGKIDNLKNRSQVIISPDIVSLDYDIIYQKFILLLETISSKYVNTSKDLVAAHIFSLVIRRGYIFDNDNPSKNTFIVLRMIIRNKKSNSHSEFLSTIRFDILNDALYLARQLHKKDQAKIQNLMKNLVVTLSNERYLGNIYETTNSIFLLNLKDFVTLSDFKNKYEINFIKSLIENDIKLRLEYFDYQNPSDLDNLQLRDQFSFRINLSNYGDPINDIFTRIILNELNLEAEQIKLEYLFGSRDYYNYLNKINENLKYVGSIFK